MGAQGNGTAIFLAVVKLFSGMECSIVNRSLGRRIDKKWLELPQPGIEIIDTDNRSGASDFFMVVIFFPIKIFDAIDD